MHRIHWFAFEQLGLKDLTSSWNALGCNGEWCAAESFRRLRSRDQLSLCRTFTWSPKEPPRGFGAAGSTHSSRWLGGSYTDCWDEGYQKPTRDTSHRRWCCCMSVAGAKQILDRYDEDDGKRLPKDAHGLWQRQCAPWGPGRASDVFEESLLQQG